MNDNAKDLTSTQRLARQLGLVGLLAHWSEVPADLAERMVNWEEQTRSQRSLGRRVAGAHLGRFKAMADFDWTWPKKPDREVLDDLFGLDFVRVASNAILVGANGTGKTMITKNLVHKAVTAGFRARFVTASDMLADLAQATAPATRQRRLRRYTRPDLLAIDEVGYLSYDNRHADLLFEVINGRYQRRSTIVTTNMPFSQWPTVFPTATCVVTLVDRLTHHAEIVHIVAESYRQHEAREQELARAGARDQKRRAK